MRKGSEDSHKGNRSFARGIKGRKDIDESRHGGDPGRAVRLVRLYEVAKPSRYFSPASVNNPLPKNRGVTSKNHKRSMKERDILKC